MSPLFVLITLSCNLLEGAGATMHGGRPAALVGWEQLADLTAHLRNAAAAESLGPPSHEANGEAHLRRGCRIKLRCALLLFELKS